MFALTPQSAPLIIMCGGKQTPSPVIYPYQFVYMQRALEKAEGASRFTALKLMVGARGGVGGGALNIE